MIIFGRVIEKILLSSICHPELKEIKLKLQPKFILSLFIYLKIQHTLINIKTWYNKEGCRNPPNLKILVKKWLSLVLFDYLAACLQNNTLNLEKHWRIWRSKGELELLNETELEILIVQRAVVWIISCYATNYPVTIICECVWSVKSGSQKMSQSQWSYLECQNSISASSSNLNHWPLLDLLVALVLH